MEVLIDNISDLGANPFAWLVAALAGIKATISIIMIFFCKVKSGEYQPTEAQAREAASAVFNPPISFLLLLVFGMALAIGGLYMLADATYGGLALGAMVIGVFMFMTEPARLQVIGAKTAVYASSLGSSEENELARGALGQAYSERATYETVIALAVFGILIFV